MYMKAPTAHFFIAKTSGNVASGIDERQKKRIQEVGTQTTLYVIAAFLTYMPLAINHGILTGIMGLTAKWQARLFRKSSSLQRLFSLRYNLLTGNMQLLCLCLV